MILKLSAFASLLLAWGCATHSPYQVGLEKAFAELENKTERTVAKKVSGIDVQKLEDFKMVVFPKAIDLHMKYGKNTGIDTTGLSGMNEKEVDEYIDSKTVYHKPLTFNFRVLKKGKCMTLSKEKKYATHLFFGGEQFDSSLQCMVLEVKKEAPKFFGKRILELKKDDILKVRLYLDEYLRPYGQSIDFAVELGRKRYRTENIKIDSSENISSGLSLYPIDLPNFKNSSVVEVGQDSVPLPRNLFLIFNVKSMVQTPICSKAKRIEHKDILGSVIESSWCEEQNWPTTIETNRFFAVLK